MSGWTAAPDLLFIVFYFREVEKKDLHYCHHVVTLSISSFSTRKKKVLNTNRNLELYSPLLEVDALLLHGLLHVVKGNANGLC